jgi:hypothetical protein
LGVKENEEQSAAGTRTGDIASYETARQQNDDLNTAANEIPEIHNLAIAHDQTEETKNETNDEVVQEKEPQIQTEIPANNPVDSNNDGLLGHIWGDTMSTRPEHTLRVMGINWCGMPKNPKDPKMESIKQTIKRLKVDVVGISEVNLDWRQLPSDAQLANRTFRWFDAVVQTTAYLKDYPAKDPIRPGGVTQWTIDKTVHRITGSGQDATGMGRWTWQRYQGKQGITLRIATAYRPCRNATGNSSVWSQQKKILEDKDVDGDPRQVFTDDLSSEIKQWQATGDQVILLIDVNEDVRSQQQNSFATSMEEIGLVELITLRHGHEGPATFLGGSKPIDGIFVTGTLTQSTCGYTAVGSDHYAMWMDIKYEVAWGQTMQDIVKPQARRLKCTDPRIVNRYNEALDNECKERNLYERANALKAKVPDEWNAETEQEWEDIDDDIREATTIAEKTCRKLKMGEIQWTPELAQIRLDIKVIGLMIKKLVGAPNQSRGRYLERLQKISSLREVTEWDLEDL